MQLCGRWFSGLLVFGLVTIWLVNRGVALDRTWIGGNVDWVDAGSTANWNPADEPDADDRAIFNTANTVNLGSNNDINGLALSGGIDLFTSGFDLTVDGLVETAGAGTNLFLGGAGAEINADDVTINADGTIELTGGTLTMDEEVGTSLIDINVGGNLIGNGTISFADTPGVVTTVLVNDGELTALSRGLTIFSPPPVGTLQINTAGPTFSRVDLDGAGEAGVVNVNRNQTLDLNVGFADAFNGTMNLFQESHFNSLNAWTLAGGSIIADNGFIDGGIFADTPAGTSFIEGGLLTQTGGAINVVDTDGTLQFDAAFTMSGGTFTNSGTVIFNGNTNITTAAGFIPSTLTSQTIINGTTSINQAAGNLNWDGPGTASTTINGTGSLTINVNQIDAPDDVFGGTLTLNDGADLSVNVAATSWTLANTLSKNNAGTSTISGDRVIMTANTIVSAGTLDMPAVTTTGTTSLSVTGTMTLGGASEFGGGSITGSGTLLMEGTSTVTANTTINVATFDWDGLGTGTNHTINDGVVFTIISSTIDTDGDMDDPINLAGSGSQLTVSGPTQWTATAAINANNAGVGTATIGGTSRMILSGANADLNVNGNTNISAPLTLGAGSLVVIDGGFTLDANGATSYSGVVIEGTGTYVPGPTNTVTAFSTIAPDVFDFDAGSWVVEPDATLSVFVTDYDTTVTNAFDGTITLNDGAINVLTSDAEFVMDGTLNMVSNNVDLAFADWLGQPLDIGNDAGVLDADVNVSGTFFSRISAPVDFNSDADINVDGVALSLDSTVNFDTVNGVNNAEFTGDGIIRFGGLVNVNEAVTLNMVGGEVDLDGSDTVGDFVNVDAPLTINAATMANFGRVNGGGGINTLDINNSAGTGVLTVNLDDPADEWTLNGPGVMNLVNDNTEATLLAGSDVNVNGTVNVTGDVRTTARLDIAGVVNVNTAGQPLRLAGGDIASEPNTISGGTISGGGVLGADFNKALYGFGTINTAIDFDDNSQLRADDGTLTVTGAVTDVGIIGTNDDDGVLNVTNAWNTNVSVVLGLLGGTVQGGTITNDAGDGIQGWGTVTARVINNSQLLSTNARTLVFETGGNDNDWDGAGGAGQLRAVGSSTLELRDNATFGFTGQVSTGVDGTVFANGFALDFNPGSILALGAGTYESTHSTDIGGAVNVNIAESTIKVTDSFFLTFESTSSTTLNSNLRLVNNRIKVVPGATFSGTGALIVDEISLLEAEPNANVNVIVDNRGGFIPGGLDAVGRVDVLDYQQSDEGELFVELTGTGLNQFDRLVVNGIALLNGRLLVELDGGFIPALGNTFPVLSTSAGVNGTFDSYDMPTLGTGNSLAVVYSANSVTLQVIAGLWGDYNGDGTVNAADYTVWRNTLGAMVTAFGGADGSGNGIVDQADYAVWKGNFGDSLGPGAGGSSLADANAAVPEPAAAVLALIASMFAQRLRRRR